MRVNFYLRNPKKKGRTAIYVSAVHRGERVILFPGESIDTAFWSNKNGINKPKPIAENNALIGRLMKFEQLLRDTHDDLQKSTEGIVSAEALKKAVDNKLKPTTEKVKTTKTKENVVLSITGFFQKMIDDTRSKKRLGVDGKAITEKTVMTYETTMNHFENFQTKQKCKCNLSNIDQKMIDAFSDYLNLHLKMAFNGSGKHMKNFRTMMNYARQKKQIGADVLIDNKVTVTKETPDNIYLTEQEIKHMMALKAFENPVYETVRDLFVIGCMTGMRFSDYSQLTLAKINNGFIQITQQKTSGRVTIPIHPIVAQILAKYPDGLPKCPANQKFNNCLKEIGKMMPELNQDFEKTLTRGRKAEATIYKKWELLQTHTARRSFCTNEYLAGTPTITIMAISGHKTDKSFMAYIKADSLKHAMVMRDRWNMKNQ